MCLEYLNGRLIPAELDITTIVLIPKKGNPEKVYLQLIALCNVLYKVMSKAIANRMKLVLPTVVLDSESRAGN